MIENMAKHMIMIKDSVLMDCLDFLEHCEGKILQLILSVHHFVSKIKSLTFVLPTSLVYGRNVKVFDDQPLEGAQIHPGQNTVTYEARILKSLLLEIVNN